MKSKSLDMLQHKYSVGMWGNQDENEKNKNDFCQLLVEMFKYFFSLRLLIMKNSFTACGAQFAFRRLQFVAGISKNSSLNSLAS